MVYRDGPDAVRNANIDALLVDEAEFAGSIAGLFGHTPDLRRVDSSHGQ